MQQLEVTSQTTQKWRRILEVTFHGRPVEFDYPVRASYIGGHSVLYILMLLMMHVAQNGCRALFTWLRSTRHSELSVVAPYVIVGFLVR